MTWEAWNHPSTVWSTPSSTPTIWSQSTNQHTGWGNPSLGDRYLGEGFLGGEEE